MSGDESPDAGAAADAAHVARELLNGILVEMNAGYQTVSSTDSASGGDERVRAVGAVPDARTTLKGLVELAAELAEVMIRVAGKIAVDVATAGAELGTVVARRAGDGSLADPLRVAPGANGGAAQTVLVLPDVSPGGTTKTQVEVRNDGLAMLDGMRLRCGGLFGPGAERILGYRLNFFPPVVDVHPNTTAKVACELVVPADTKRARYFGVIEAAGTPGVQLLVSLNVI